MTRDIRRAEASDHVALQDIERRAGERFRSVGMPEIADDEPLSTAELAAAELVLVASDAAGAPVGYAVVELVDRHAHLEQLSVIPEAGGQGIGTALIEAVVAWARDRGDREVTLTTFRDVAFNAPLYATRGFTVVDEPQWTQGLRSVVAKEAAHGLDVTTRVVMRRAVSPVGGASTRGQ